MVSNLVWIPYAYFNWMLSTMVCQLFTLIGFGLTLNSIGLDPDEYLPEASQAWCRLQLEHIGITSPITTSMQREDGTPVHKVAYLYLREVGNHFITNGGRLTLSNKPTGTYSWDPSADLQQEEHVEINLDVDEQLGELGSVYISQDSD